MKLLDANLSPRIATALGHAGYVVVTVDSDFPTLTALRRATSPSVVLLRGVSELSSPEHARLPLANLPAVHQDLDAGAVVCLSPTYMRVRDLPIRWTPLAVPRKSRVIADHADPGEAGDDGGGVVALHPVVPPRPRLLRRRGRR